MHSGIKIISLHIISSNIFDLFYLFLRIIKYNSSYIPSYWIISLVKNNQSKILFLIKTPPFLRIFFLSHNTVHERLIPTLLEIFFFFHLLSARQSFRYNLLFSSSSLIQMNLIKWRTSIEKIKKYRHSLVEQLYQFILQSLIF